MTASDEESQNGGNGQAGEVFIELVKALARRRARIDLLHPSSVNDNDKPKDDRGTA